MGRIDLLDVRRDEDELPSPQIVIGQRATIVGFDQSHDPAGVFVAHICLDLEDGRRLFVESPAGPLRFTFEPRGSHAVPPADVPPAGGTPAS